MEMNNDSSFGVSKSEIIESCKEANASSDRYDLRRQGIDRLVGIVNLSEDFDSRTIKEERLARHEF